MHCPKCGVNCPEESTYCSGCGEKIAGTAPPQTIVKPPEPRILFYLLSFICSLIGGILGLYYLVKPPATCPECKKFGLKCLILGTILPIITFLFILLFLIIGAILPRETLENKGATPLLEVSQSTSETPSEVVDSYMKATLGAIPGANLNYTLAKNHLVPEMQAQFDDASFVPLSYCIQNGPDTVRIESEDISDDEATVRVSTQYGADFGAPFEETWDFLLDRQEGAWKIASIVCLDWFD